MARKKKKKVKVNYTESSSGVITLHLDPNALTARNEGHFQIQLHNKAQIYADKTKYTRKKKHKNKED